MGIYRGPNTIKDGLVFGYDTNYGVADVNTSTRYYLGRPTTNLGPSSLADWGTEGTAVRILTAEVYKHQPVYNCRTAIGEAWKGIDKTIPGLRTAGGSGNVTMSVMVRNMTTVDVPLSAYMGHDFSSTYTVPANGVWNKYQWTVNISAMGNDYVEMRPNTGITTSYLQMTMPQVEVNVGSIATPFTEGTRTVTASLIDLKKSTSIDLSNVSFDSTGQPEFDGTDDYIDLGNLSVIRLGKNFTIEALVRPEQDKWMYFFWKGYGSNNSLAWGRHSNGNWFFSTMVGGSYYNINMGTAVVNEYCHLSATYDGINIRLYENGVHKTTSGATHDMMTSNASLGIGGPDRYWNGKIPIVKIYNKVLTPTEITQNFNAQKSRFGL